MASQEDSEIDENAVTMNKSIKTRNSKICQPKLIINNKNNSYVEQNQQFEEYAPFQTEKVSPFK